MSICRISYQWWLGTASFGLQLLLLIKIIDNFSINTEKSLRLMVSISKTLKLALRQNVHLYKIQVKILRLKIHNNEKSLR
jgi:hypothetical protein